MKILHIRQVAMHKKTFFTPHAYSNITASGFQLFWINTTA